MKQLFLICSVIALAFTSCYSYSPPPSRFLDVEKHNEMLKKWKELNIKNYSFTYSFDHWYSGPEFKVIGNVTVKNGIGDVVFMDNEWGYGNKKPSKNSYYHITNIEDAFKRILGKNEEHKDDMTKKRWQGVWYKEEYDKRYFFPKYIYYHLECYGHKPIPDLVGDSGGPSETFRIKNFKIFK